MKILHVIDSAGLYGAETMLLHLMTEQLGMGLDPLLVSIGLPTDQEKPLEIEARRRGLQVIPFRMRSGPNWVGAFSILQIAHQKHVDVLHSHGYKGNILFGLVSRAVRRLPMISTLHGWTSVTGLSRMRLYEWLEILSLRLVDRVVVVNETMRQIPRVKTLSSEKLEVIENGIPFEPSETTWEVRPEIQYFSASRFTFLAIGRLSPEKNFGTLLQAMADVAVGNDARLVILGEGEQRLYLEEKVRELGLGNRVLMPGFVAEAKEYLPLFDAFVISSLTEGLPMVLLEAMAAGIPIVATRVGGIPEVLEDGLGGELINAGDRDALKRAMVSIINDAQLTKERAIWAAKRVRERYSSRTMAEKYMRQYLKLTNEPVAK
jgi:glycosyltransferase involved in cell wall biosynthesis